MLNIPLPEGLSYEGKTAIIILVVALVLIIKEPIPLPAVAIFIIISQIYSNVDLSFPSSNRFTLPNNSGSDN